MIIAVVTALSRSLPSAVEAALDEVGQPVVEGVAELGVHGLVFPRGPARDGQRPGELAI